MPKVVTCILENDGDILILRRSEAVSTYREQWGGVAGYIEEDETPMETALKEIKEEVGLKKNEVLLMKQEEVISLTDFYEGKLYDWVIHPFLFHIADRKKIQMDGEHTEFQWIHPKEIEKYDTVPHLKEIVKKMCL